MGREGTSEKEKHELIKKKMDNKMETKVTVKSCLRVQVEDRRQKLANKEEAGIHAPAKFFRCLACKRKYSITPLD